VRSLIIVTILCFTSIPAFACVFDTDCKPGSECRDGACTRDLLSDDGHDDAPVKPPTSKTCIYDDDCSPGSSCIKGTGLKGVCIGH
jgi:hypothetical protein